MTPVTRARAETYANWYATPRGRWIGDAEFALVRGALQPRSGENLLDVGCGTGYFTARFAAEARMQVVGLDPDLDGLEYARAHSTGVQFVAGVAEKLPFADASFDHTMAITSLCFVADLRSALGEIARVTRRRFALGLLNRRSLLYLQKGRGGGAGAYRGARWDSADDIRRLLAELPVTEVLLQSAVFLPDGGAVARAIETIVSPRRLFGGFLLVSGSLDPRSRSKSPS